MAWSGDGGLLATASAKGTVIRVHRLPSAARAHSFRRGTLSAAINSMAFSPPGAPLQLLAAASSHGTVHVFRLEVRGWWAGGLVGWAGLWGQAAGVG